MSLWDLVVRIINNYVWEELSSDLEIYHLVITMYTAEPKLSFDLSILVLAGRKAALDHFLASHALQLL